jgi:hypothetical protein
MQLSVRLLAGTHESALSFGFELCHVRDSRVKEKERHS